VFVVDGFGNSNRGDSESAAIAQLFPRSQLIETTSASDAELLRSFESAKILHFSGHAKSEAGSQLMLTSGAHQPRRYLSADKIGTLHFKRCQIAVLAACNTSSVGPHKATEDPDLRDSMLRAGAKTVVASSWEVDDHSTQVLMLRFYRELLRGRTPSLSLRAAASSVQSMSAWAHPFYWASFEAFLN